MTINPRTCVGCRQRDARDNLVRVVAGTSAVEVDEKARLQGRGAWIHRDSACLNRAVRSRAFERALRKQGLDSAPCSQWLERYLSSGAKAPN